MRLLAISDLHLVSPQPRGSSELPPQPNEALPRSCPGSFLWPGHANTRQGLIGAALPLRDHRIAHVLQVVDTDLGAPESGRCEVAEAVEEGDAVALPERSSAGMIRSTRTRTVAHSCSLKNPGTKAEPVVVAWASAPRAFSAAAATSRGVHNSPDAEADAISLSAWRRFNPVADGFLSLPIRDSPGCVAR